MPSSSSTTLPDFLHLQPHRELGLQAARWLRPVAAHELQQGYEAILATEPNTRYWLFDLRQRGPASEDDTHWVLTYFVTRMATQLKGRVYLAFLVSAGHLTAEEQQTGSVMLMDERAQVRLFADETPALHWLTNRQHHDSA